MGRMVSDFERRDRLHGRSMNKTGGRFAGALAAAIVVTALAAMPAIAQQQRPFSGVFSGNVAFTSPSTAAYQGSGTATHLGRSTVVGTVAAVGPANCEGFAAQHTITITAADGDQLFLVVTDDSCLEGPNQYHGLGTFEITGGTGRFTDATGSGTFEGHGDFNAGTFLQTLEGTISY